MYFKPIIVVFFSLFCLVALSHAQVRIIYETDMAADVDDAGALGVLHALADRGEARILAVMINSSCSHSAGAAQAINDYYRRGNIPIGVYRGRRVDGGRCGRYARQIAERARTREAKSLYRSLLRRNRGVTIVSVGFLGNLDALMRDAYMRSLVNRRVRRLVIMGGMLRGGREFNVRASGRGVARNVIDNWPGEIVFSPFEIGAEVRTGSRMQSAPGASPVRDAYWHYHRRRWNRLRASWDQTAVLFGVRGLRNYWRINRRGGMTVDQNGYSRWNSRLRRDHSHLRRRMSPRALARVIDDLMIARPR